MTVTRLTPTTFAVSAESLSCSRSGCEFRTYAGKVGDTCPRCIRNEANVAGLLEQTTYRVDLESYAQCGRCDCHQFRCKTEPKLKELRGAVKNIHHASRNQFRCKHILAARREAKQDKNFDAILAALPDQEEQT